MDHPELLTSCFCRSTWNCDQCCWFWSESVSKRHEQRNLSKIAQGCKVTSLRGTKILHPWKNCVCVACVALCQAHYTRDVARVTQTFYKHLTGLKNNVKTSLVLYHQKKIDKNCQSQPLDISPKLTVGGWGTSVTPIQEIIFASAEYVNLSFNQFPVIWWLLNGA